MQAIFRLASDISKHQSAELIRHIHYPDVGFWRVGLKGGTLLTFVALLACLFMSSHDINLLRNSF